MFFLYFIFILCRTTRQEKQVQWINVILAVHPFSWIVGCANDFGRVVSDWVLPLACLLTVYTDSKLPIGLCETEPHQTPETRIVGLQDAKEIASISFAIWVQHTNVTDRRRDISCNGKGTLHCVLWPKPHHAALVGHNSIKPFKIYPSNRLHYDMAPGQSSDKRFKMQHCRHSSADISSCSFNLVAVIARSPMMTIALSNSGILTQHFLN